MDKIKESKIHTDTSFFHSVYLATTEKGKSISFVMDGNFYEYKPKFFLDKMVNEFLSEADSLKLPKVKKERIDKFKN